MSSFVDGERELTGEIRFAPLGTGRTSIGVRQNRVSWFKGLIHSVRITDGVLTSDQLLRVPSRRPEGRQVIPRWPEDTP
jgi:hypothetical protein